MFGKYNDYAAAILIGIYLLGLASYIVQLFFMTEWWLADNQIDITAITIARVAGAAWCGLFVGIILTFLNGPDGQKTLFWSICVAQVLCLFWVAHSYLVLNIAAAADDSVIVLVLTILILVGTFRVKSRL